MILISILLGLHAAAAIAYLICHRQDGDRKYLGLMFLFLPVLGPLVYVLCRWLWRHNKLSGYDRDYLVQRYDMMEDTADIDVQQSLEVAPLDDVLSVSGKEERRRLLLSGLKKGISENYKSFLRASNNEDTETAHYIASAKMTVFRELYEAFSKAGEAHEAEPTRETERELLLSIDKLVKSQLLSEEEVVMYRTLFCDTLTEPERQEADILEMYLEHLRELQRDTEAETLWRDLPLEEKTEPMYKTMLNLYYSRRQTEAFSCCLQELKKAPLTLSAEGLQLLRFWERKEIHSCCQ